MSSLLLPVLLLAATAATTDSLSVIPGCRWLCGGVEIPFPFGIGTNCSRSGFEIDCINNGSAGEIPVLAKVDQTIPVLHLSVSPFPEARVLLPVAWQCFNSTGYVIGSSMGGANFNPEGVYRISNTKNELYVLGCNTLAYVSGGRNAGAGFRYKSYTGCIAVASERNDPQDDACAGVGCCRVNIPPGITDTRMVWNGWSRADQEFCPCDYAFVVDKESYTFKASNILSTHIPNNQTMPLLVDWTVPLRLDWAIRDNGSTSLSCSQAPTKTDHEYACRSHRSECVDSTNGPGYHCNCTEGYEGNPYVVGGCTNIDECQRIEFNSCPSGSKCIDTEGSYKCRCKFGRRGKDCHPIIPKRAIVTISATFVGILLLALLLWFVHMDRKRRMKAAFFDKNGGKILMGAAGINIFTGKQLEKITNHYETLIGEGAFGKVFLGTTDEKQLVAVKRSNSEGKNVGKRDNLQQGDDIVNEITFQFGNSHHNLVRLVGCCLETNIPVLVFEFISKGSLHKLLHEDPHELLGLPTRLDIAIGSAEALAYIHSKGDRIHGDIKSANILLDDNLKPKVSDFGSSKILSVDMYARAVAADMSYIDPVYMKTGHFVAKSDVYSFSVVLLELITRKTVKYGENKINSLPVNFVKSCKEMGNGREMYDRDILTHGVGAQCQHCMECLDKIGTLAVRCLKEDVDERPTMAEVVKKLKEAAKSREADKKAIPFLPRFPGAAVSSPPLLRPLRRRKGGGTPDLCGRCVNRVGVCVAGGGVCVGAAATRSGLLSPRTQLPLVAAPRSGDGSVGVPLRGRFGDGDGRVLWDFLPWACRRRVVVSSYDDARLLRYDGGLSCQCCGREDLVLRRGWLAELSFFSGGGWMGRSFRGRRCVGRGPGRWGCLVLQILRRQMATAARKAVKRWRSLCLWFRRRRCAAASPAVEIGATRRFSKMRRRWASWEPGAVENLEISLKHIRPRKNQMLLDQFFDLKKANSYVLQEQELQDPNKDLREKLQETSPENVLHVSWEEGGHSGASMNVLDPYQGLHHHPDNDPSLQIGFQSHSLGPFSWIRVEEPFFWYIMVGNRWVYVNQHCALQLDGTDHWRLDPAGPDQHSHIVRLTVPFSSAPSLSCRPGRMTLGFTSQGC